MKALFLTDDQIRVLQTAISVAEHESQISVNDMEELSDLLSSEVKTTEDLALQITKMLLANTMIDEDRYSSVYLVVQAQLAGFLGMEGERQNG